MRATCSFIVEFNLHVQIVLDFQGCPSKLPSVNRDHYKTALEAARQELAELEDQRAKIDKRISELQHGIVGLSALAPDHPDAEKPQSMMDVLTGVGVDTGLTDATRMITSSFGFPMTPKQVRDALLHLGYDLSGYSNILASLHTIMKRLAKSQELINILDDKGNELGAYAWNPAVSVRRQKPVSASFDMNIESLHGAKRTLNEETAEPTWKKLGLRPAPLSKDVVKKLKEKRTEWDKYLTEGGGIVLSNPPYFATGKRLTARQRRELQQAREEVEEVELRKQRGEFDRSKKGSGSKTN